MAKHAATPNSECTQHVSPASVNDTASASGSRYGKGGHAPGQGDNSSERIVTSSG